jgi:hypothetical protein
MRGIRLIRLLVLLTTTLFVAGCDANVGVGLSVGVPVGSHGYMSIGGSRWY